LTFELEVHKNAFAAGASLDPTGELNVGPPGPLAGLGILYCSSGLGEFLMAAVSDPSVKSNLVFQIMFIYPCCVLICDTLLISFLVTRIVPSVCACDIAVS